MIKPKRAGKTVAAGVTLVAAVGAAVLATIFMRGGGTGEGAGSGTGPAGGTGTTTGVAPVAPPASSTESPKQASADDAPAAATPPQRPLKVTVRESTYLVNGREVDLAELGQLAAEVPEGSGPAVVIERDPTSRAKAEQELIQALDERKVPHASD